MKLLTDDPERGNFPCGRGNCEICNILKPGNQFKSMVTGEIYKMNFYFDYNSLCDVYFNQYKSNLKLYGEGRRGFFQEMLTEHFLIGQLCMNYQSPHLRNTIYSAKILTWNNT